MSRFAASTALRGAMAFAIIAVLGLAGLAVAGVADQRRTAFSVDVPDAQAILTLAPGQLACQGPVPVAARFAGIELWLDAVRPPGSRVRITVLSPDRRQLATGLIRAPFAIRPTGGSKSRLLNTSSARLSRSVAAGSTVSFCLRNVGTVSASLLGTPAQPGSGVLERGGSDLGTAASIVLLAPRSRSLLRSLPTVFSRAALFRPSWMGAWTFWLLLAGVLVAFALGGLAVALAGRDDAVQDPA